jgi:hypothetical protein
MPYFFSKNTKFQTTLKTFNKINSLLAEKQQQRVYFLGGRSYFFMILIGIRPVSVKYRLITYVPF